MKRIHFIEIADQAWCPQPIKNAVTDYCRFVLTLSKTYQAIAPLLAGALQRTGARRVLDLGSGAAGPWIELQPLVRQLGVDVSVCLSDHYPNIQALERARCLTRQAINYLSEPVDATRVPRELSGFRTMFTAFHHLRPEQARAMLADAVAKGEGIAVFEPGERNFLILLLFPLLLVTPLRVLIATPFIRPFRWSRLLWTYLVPAVPLVLLFDSIISVLRLYSVHELRGLTAGLDSYHWDISTVRGKPIPIPITYLIGVPIEKVLKEGSDPIAKKAPRPSMTRTVTGSSRPLDPG
jgi:hypothetical protein